MIQCFYRPLMVPNSNRFPASLEKGRKSPEEVHVLKNHRSRPIKLGQLCTLSFTHSVSRSVPLLHPQSYHSRPVAAMDDRSSAMPASFLDVPTDDALLVKGLPPVSFQLFVVLCSSQLLSFITNSMLIRIFYLSLNQSYLPSLSPLANNSYLNEP